MEEVRRSRSREYEYDEGEKTLRSVHQMRQHWQEDSDGRRSRRLIHDGSVAQFIVDNSLLLRSRIEVLAKE